MTTTKEANDTRTTVRRAISELDQGLVERLLARLEGLTDEEYLWEPVPGCWSVRPSGDEFAVEWEHHHPDTPLTTIAARLWHIGARPWPVPAPASAREGIERHFRQPYAPPGRSETDACGTAAAAIASLREQWESRRAHYDALSDDDLAEKIGPVGHRYADVDYAGLLLHWVDERIHHAAEVALMRDFYRAAR